MKQTSFLVPSLVLALLLTCCESNPTDPGPPKIVTGTTVDVTTQSVPSSGGTITVSKPGDSLDGLTIDVPNGAYSEARSFRISYAPVTKHEFGSDFIPLTPLITIENGGGYTDSLMLLRIPVKVPTGHFAMAFLFDPSNNQLEGMPLLESDSEHVTVVTTNFEHSAVSGFGKRVGIAEGGGSSKIVVASTPETSLSAGADGKFLPGVDDWQFGDHATYVSPEGITPGQTISALWYYIVQKKINGAPSLNGRFEDDGVLSTPKLWQDDVKALKLCAMLSKGFTSSGFNEAWVRAFQDKRQDRKTLDQLAFSIRETEVPQYILAAGATKSTLLIVYKVSSNTIYVADPAYPGDRNRTIEFNPATGTFAPYVTGSTTLTTIYYQGKSSAVNWHGPANRWKEFESGTIGNGSFPEYSLLARDSTGNNVPLVDNFTVNGSQLTLSVNGTGSSGTFDVYNEQGTKFSKSGSSVQLPSGKQLIGIHLMDDKSNWVGFKWVRVEATTNTDTGPTIFGVFDYVPVALQFTVDGQQQTVDSARFIIGGNNTGRYSFNLLANVGGKGFLTIDASSFKGEGSYPLVESVPGQTTGTSNYWVEDYAGCSDCPCFRAQDVNPGVLMITSWRKNSVVGNFTFRGKGCRDNSEATVSGTFHYPP